MKFHIGIFVFLLSTTNSYTRRSANYHKIFERDISSVTIPNFECVDKPESDFNSSREITLSEEDIIPCGYNPIVAPSGKTADNVQVEFRILHIRDIDEKNQHYTLEVNFRMLWEDKRLRNITIPDGTKFIPVYPEVLTKLWNPDIIIDNVKEVSQPVVFTKPFSLRLYRGSIIRYSARLTIKMSCSMDFMYYPADTQRCTICLRSLDFSRVNLTWSSSSDAVKIAEDVTMLSSYDVKVARVRNYNEPTGEKKGTLFRVVKFDMLFKRNMNYHMVQTICPSILFIIISWLAFLVPPDNVSARMTLCMSTLLTLTTMFAVVRQNTPNESYAKALDVWMLACVFFVFGTLVEYTVLIYLNSRIVQVKKNDDYDQDTRSTRSKTGKKLNWSNLSFGILKRKKSPEDTSPGIAAALNSPSGSGEEEISTREILLSKYGESSQCSVPGTSSDSQPGPSRAMDSTIPEFENRPVSISVRNTDPQKYKKIAMAIERIASFSFPCAFLVFNIIFWPTLLIQSGYFADPDAN
ncbi:unnamed protein product [Allacma fusca]|uniref:Uncharacterized protein n=1 Tax=Allacma fusca TaxID=39272 RepID=A0A8J2PJ68_9HEXA|nr:unnamed protein product [Allacma fusca]